jgi:two-component system NtrC family sensor kinase
MEAGSDETSLKELEKRIRILTKKLERSEADRQQLEDASELRERILKGVIREFEASQIQLENRGRELEIALGNLKTLQVKLIESEKMSALGILIAGIAHEINNPVNFIHGNLDHAEQYLQDLLKLIDLYQHHYPDPAGEIRQELKDLDLDFIQQDLSKLFHSMQSGAERIASIVKSFRTFSRLDEASFKPVYLHEGLDSTLMILNKRLQPTPKSPNGIRLIRDYGQLPLVECYASQLNQVFMNLLINAIDALEESDQQHGSEQAVTHPKTIWIRTSLQPENRVVIAIADNGVGIPEAIWPKLFDPFFTTKPVGKGTGLGLAISHQIVTELHGGKLDFKSIPGQHTEFLITLPITVGPGQSCN